VEQEEELIANRLMKRLELLKREKQSLAREVEQEEEYLTNNLQKRMLRLGREKAALENRLEAEQARRPG
jgi:coiled-coil domain-containing protein 6